MRPKSVGETMYIPVPSAPPSELAASCCWICISFHYIFITTTFSCPGFCSPPHLLSKRDKRTSILFPSNNIKTKNTKPRTRYIIVYSYGSFGERQWPVAFVVCDALGHPQRHWRASVLVFCVVVISNLPVARVSKVVKPQPITLAEYMNPDEPIR